MTRALTLISTLALASVSGAALAADGHAHEAHEAHQSSEAHAPLFASEMELARGFVDGMMEAGVVVPQPKDPGGGYTHEQHKRNFRAIYQGGQLFEITGDERYRDYVRDMLLEYAELYPTLGEHPAKANQYSGRIFWQVLNLSLIHI